MVQFLMIEHFNARQIVRDTAREEEPREEDLGYRRTLAEWRKPYPTRDGHVCFMPYNDRDWRAFFAEIGRADLAGDPRFLTVASRAQNIETLYQLLEGIIAGRDTAHWLALGDRLGIACATVNSMAELEADPHLQAVGMFAHLETDSDWQMRYVRSPVRLQDSEVEARRPPRLGEHTSEVLRELGLPAETLAAILRGDR